MSLRQNFSFLNTILLSFFAAFAIKLVLLLFLPKEGVEFFKKDKIEKYPDISLLFFGEKITVFENGSKLKDLDRFELVALYTNKEELAVVKTGKKYFYVNKNGMVNGYRFIKIQKGCAIFSKDKKLYRVCFKKRKGDKEKRKKSIDKKLIKGYLSSPGALFKKIRFYEKKLPEGNIGYIVTYVSKGSVFEGLGLKVGDMIIKIDGEEIKNRFELLSKIKNLYQKGRVSLTVKRGDFTKDLEYEID